LYALERGAWGGGIATEAARAAVRFGFEAAGLERIVAAARPDNAPSRRVMEKIGLRWERDLVLWETDAVLYAIGRTEFLRGRS
ncbi:MAG: GNAT family N-acetyltransferase, partial [Candidatus Rokuibacteriota bacterium]